MMLLEKYRRRLSHVRVELQTRMIEYFVGEGLVHGDVPGETFYDVLEEAGLCQADVVLCALRVNSASSLRLAESLVGKKILRCPPCLGRWRDPRRLRKQGDDRTVTVVRQPRRDERIGVRRLYSADLYERIGRARVGMSVRSLLGRGLKRRDIRIALHRQYMELSA